MSNDIKAPSVLQVKNLHKSFDGNKVLDDISLSARAHDVITLVGSSGSGKTTLLRCLNLLESPDAGTLEIHGEALDLACYRSGNHSRDFKRQIQRLRTRLGMVFQQFNLWSHMTVLENVMLGPCMVLKRDRQAVKVQAEQLLDRVGMADRRDMYPDYLSGGQKQRAAIARALAMEPDALLFDEPTSALDPELVDEVLHVIQELAKEGRTMIMVTHEMRFARDVSSEIIYLRQGKIEEQGQPDELFNHPRSENLQRFLSSIA